MARATIALGSNLGDKLAALKEAAEQIGHLPETRILARSGVYRTPPWGMTAQDWFANAVLIVETGLSPDAMLEACLRIETAMGRVRQERWGPRRIDLDLLYHGKSRRNSARLTLPHPAIGERAFVLIPLNDIAPRRKPGGASIQSLLAKLDAVGIERIADSF